MTRSRVVALLSLLLLSLPVACQSQTTAQGDQPTVAKPKIVELPGVNVQKLTQREKEQWSAYVSEMLAPCPDQPVSLAQCVQEKRDCETCLPAARFLSAQVTKGKTRSQAEDAFRARFSPDTVKEIALADSPSKGAADAKVTIVEWADFECPFCSRASPLLGLAVKKHEDDVRLVFKHYPLSGHEHALGAARAGVAAGMQGKFWEMHDAMFKNQTSLDETGLEKLAKDVGLDLVKFKADQRSEAVADKVTADRKQADELGLTGTPMVYINGRHFDLEKFDMAEDLEAWLELEIALRTGGEGKPQKPNAAEEATVKQAAPDKPGADGEEATGAEAKKEAPKDAPAKAPANRPAGG